MTPEGIGSDAELGGTMRPSVLMKEKRLVLRNQGLEVGIAQAKRWAAR